MCTFKLLPAASEPVNVGVADQPKNDSMILHWDHPADLNGLLQAYNITYRELPDEREPGELQWIIVNGSDLQSGFVDRRDLTTQSTQPSLMYTMKGLKSGMSSFSKRLVKWKSIAHCQHNYVI